MIQNSEHTHRILCINITLCVHVSIPLTTSVSLEDILYMLMFYSMRLSKSLPESVGAQFIFAHCIDVFMYPDDTRDQYTQILITSPCCEIPFILWGQGQRVYSVGAVPKTGEWFDDSRLCLLCFSVYIDVCVRTTNIYRTPWLTDWPRGSPSTSSSDPSKSIAHMDQIKLESNSQLTLSANMYINFKKKFFT